MRSTGGIELVRAGTDKHHRPSLGTGPLAIQEHARPRKRTRRACDKCSTSRTRCDGDYPCRRCQDYGYTCRYNREVKKRGRLPTSAATNAGAESKASSSETHFHDELQPPSPPASVQSPTKAAPSSLPIPLDIRDDDAPTMQQSSHDATTTGSPPLDFFQQPPQTHQHQHQQQQQQQQQQRASISATVATDIASLASSADFQATASISNPSPILQSGPHMASSLPLRDDGIAPESDVFQNDGGASSFSSLHGAAPGEFRRNCHVRGSFRSGISNGISRASFSTGMTAMDDSGHAFVRKPSSDESSYKFLDPVLPYLRDIIPASVACDLLEIFMTDPGSSLFRGASPYILTRVFRKQSVLHPTNPRRATPALLATILWCVAQTADVMLLHVPGNRAKVVNDLYDLATSLTSDRDPDRWRRIHGGLRAENEVPHPKLPNPTTIPDVTAANEPAGQVDDVLTFILLSIAVSGSDFKSDCYKWWSKAIRLAMSLGLNREDEQCPGPVSPCANPLCSCHRDQDAMSLEAFERREERRRVFWLLYSLDRHLALSFNSALTIPDSYCEVYTPLPESVWENLDNIPFHNLPPRSIGPPTVASGTGYFEYFLPLMAILGDIIEIHHRRRHPRLGELDDTHSVMSVQELLSQYELSLNELENDSNGSSHLSSAIQTEADDLNGNAVSPISPTELPHGQVTTEASRLRLVKAYSTHILHVLHVLLHGKWDAISMLDDGDGWITSDRFNECASHAIAASHSVSTILTIDPELTFMSYLFGIYLLQGSFILLLFADRMPQLGPNPSVEQACENIIRAHEVCVVTLSTEFQKNFRRVLRSTLYSVRGAGTTGWEEHRARRRALSLYRWTKGAKGLAL